MAQTADPAVAPTQILDSGSFTARRIERIMQVASAAGCLIIGAQAFVATFGSDDAGVWHVPLAVLVLTSVTAMIIACFFGVGVRFTATALAIIYPAVVVLWPIVTAHSRYPGTSQPWIWYVTNIATLAAVLVFPLAMQLVWTLALPSLFFFSRMTQVEWNSDYLIPNLFDLSFALCLGVVLLMLVRTIRNTGKTVDEARARALAQYTKAAAAQAADDERIEMAALMHDSVMAALIAAARATTERERALTVAMAQDALTGLADAETDERSVLGAPVSVRSVARDLTSAARGLGVAIEIAEPAEYEIPGHVARALSLAGTQAIANAVQHAKGQGLAVYVTGEAGSCTVDVIDAGSGIDMAQIPEDRLGIRASIFARMAAVGGSATIDSQPGETIVRMEWRA